MKIRVGIVDSDKNYLEKISTKFLTEYTDSIELYLYTSIESAAPKIDDKKIKVLVMNTAFKDHPLLSTIRCAFLYISEDNSDGKIGDVQVVGKYRRVSDLYKSILGVYSDSTEAVYSANSTGNCQVIAFASPAGGTGSSTMAVACAVRAALQGKGVLYLNLEKIPAYYFAQNDIGFEEIIYSIKNGHGNLKMKLESFVKNSPEKVAYFPRIGNILDLSAFEPNDKEELIKAAANLDGISFMIVDMSFDLNKDTYRMLDLADQIVVTSDGSEVANQKIFEALNAIELSQGEYMLDAKISLLYNKFSEGSPVGRISNIKQKTVGVANRYKMPQRDIVNNLSKTTLFDSLL